jgi:hypothetical protein
MTALSRIVLNLVVSSLCLSISTGTSLRIALPFSTNAALEAPQSSLPSESTPEETPGPQESPSEAPESTDESSASELATLLQLRNSKRFARFATSHLFGGSCQNSRRLVSYVRVVFEHGYRNGCGAALRC